MISELSDVYLTILYLINEKINFKLFSSKSSLFKHSIKPKSWENNSFLNLSYFPTFYIKYNNNYKSNKLPPLSPSDVNLFISLLSLQY